MKVYHGRLKTGIARTKEFERKKLACFAVNVGTKCGHGCLYCSTGTILRMHPAFKAIGRSSFESGYAVVDPMTLARVTKDARCKTQRGLVQLCTTTDAWSPEAQEHDLGRQCLESILAEPGWTVRVLTKNAAVAKDFDLIERYRDRVLVGVSITATPDKSQVMSVIEPHASPMAGRIAVMQEAHARGLRTYAMLCPLLPSISDSITQIDELVRLAVGFGAEEIFAEPMNGRGSALRLTEEALRAAGHAAEALAISAIRNGKMWSHYAANLIARMQRSARDHGCLERLKVLLYPSRLQPRDLEQIRQDDAGVLWLGKE